MDRHRPSRFSFGRLASVISILGVATAILVPTMVARLRPTPTIPTSQPIESYRVYLPSGWSMVRPPYWEVILEDKADGSGGHFFFFTSSLVGTPRLRVDWSKEEPETGSEGVEVSFQGRPARLVTEYDAPRPSSFLGGDRREVDGLARCGRLRATLIAHRDDRWLSIYYGINAASPAVPDVMWKYFETVRAPSDAAKPAP